MSVVPEDSVLILSSHCRFNRSSFRVPVSPLIEAKCVVFFFSLIDCLFGKHKQYASHGRYTWQNKLWQYNIDHSK